jgi:hypothetical protein
MIAVDDPPYARKEAMSRYLGKLSAAAVGAMALVGAAIPLTSPALAQMQGQQQDQGQMTAPAPHETAKQNVRQSQQYEQMLHANRGFRDQRMQKECGSINDAKLHADCVASFNRDNPGGSGMTSRTMHHRRRSHAAPASETNPGPATGSVPGPKDSND